MAVLLFPLVFVGIVVGILALVFRWQKARADVWRRFATTHRMSLKEAGWTHPPQITGFYKSTGIIITLEHRGSGNSRQTYTKATALFGAQLPAGMRLGREGVGTSLAKLFGAQDIQVGLPDVDAHLRIQGNDPSGISQLLRTGRVAEAAVRFVSSGDDAYITQQGASVLTTGHANQTEQLESLMNAANHVVRFIEQELRWSPDRAGKHTGVRRPRRRVRRGDAADDAPEGEAAVEQTSAADDMIAALAADGVAESSGTFTMDREVAREKMQAYQLRAPEAYVLELVQAAVHKGATRLDFTVDSAEMKLRFNGRPFGQRDFEELYASLFTDRAEPDIRARQRLAIGLNAVLGTEPKEVTVVSGDAEAAWQLVCERGEEERIEPLDPVPAAPSSYTTVHVKSRFGQRFAGLGDKVEEKLKLCCRYADAEVVCNERRISGGLTPQHAYGVVEVKGESIRGECGFSRERAERAEVRIVTAGVWITSYSLPHGLPGLLAVVESDRLSKDLSQSEVLHDEAWADLIDAVYDAEPKAVDAFATEIVRLFPDRSFPARWALDVLRAQCRAFDKLDDFRKGGPAEALGKAPLWSTVAGTLISLRALIDRLDKKHPVEHADYVATALRLNVHGLAQAGFPVHHVLHLNWRTPPADATFLAHIFRGKLRSANEQLLSYLS